MALVSVFFSKMSRSDLRIWKKIKVRKFFKVRFYVEIQLDLVKNRRETTIGVRKGSKFPPAISFYHYVKKNSARRSAKKISVEKNQVSKKINTDWHDCKTQICNIIFKTAKGFTNVLVVKDDRTKHVWWRTSRWRRKKSTLFAKGIVREPEEFDFCWRWTA